MNAVDVQKTFLEKNGDSAVESLRIVSEGIPEHLLQEDHVLYVALKTIAQKKAHRKWTWIILTDSLCEDIHPSVAIPNLKIEIIPRAGKKQKQDLYRSANVFVVHNGSRKASMEAMALGVPVIQLNNFRLGSFVENGKNCLLVPLNNPKALALAMERVLVDTDLANHLRVGGALAVCTHSVLDDKKALSVVARTKSSMLVEDSISPNPRQAQKNHFPSAVPAVSTPSPYSLSSFDDGTLHKLL